MKLSLNSFGILLIILVFVSACKKKADTRQEYPFTITIENKTFQIDSLVYGNAYLNSLTGSSHILVGYSKSKDCYVTFNLDNPVDTFAIGNFITSGNISVKRVKGFYMHVRFGTRYEDNVTYYQTEPDFSVNIISKTPGFIKGTMSGKLTGGNPNPGGFVPTSYSNMRTVQVDAKFNVSHFYF